jgi:hypothetical protein
LIKSRQEEGWQCRPSISDERSDVAEKDFETDPRTFPREEFWPALVSTKRPGDFALEKIKTAYLPYET